MIDHAVLCLFGKFYLKCVCCILYLFDSELLA